MKGYLKIFLTIMLFNVDLIAQSSWEKVYEFDQYMRAMTFDNSLYGFAVSAENGGVYKTTDGGKSWKIIYNFSNLNDIKKAGNIIVAGGGPSIILSKDGGKSWKQTFDTSIDVRTLYIRSDNTIFAADASGIILKSSDYGANWKKVKVPILYIKQIEFSDNKIGFALSKDGTYITSDGGENWFSYTSEVITGRMDAVKFLNSKIGYATGINWGVTDAHIMKTNDGGATWSEIGIVPWTISKICLFEDKSIWLCSNDAILFSDDKGESWYIQSTPSYMTSVDFPDSITGFLLDGSLLYKSSNRGIGCPTLKDPANGSIQHPFSLSLAWKSNNTCPSYKIIISKDSLFNAIIHDASTNDTTLFIKNLLPATKYYWRVCSQFSSFLGPWSQTFSFTTANDSNPIISYPLDNSSNVLLKCVFSWINVIGNGKSLLVIAEDSLFKSIYYENSEIYDTKYEVKLESDKKYFFKIGVQYAGNNIYWSEYAKFTTGRDSTLFPLHIGNKWYYTASSNSGGFYYGCTKEITAELSNGFKELTCKYFYYDSIVVKKEYLGFFDGKLYYSTKPEVKLYAIYYSNLKKDTTLDIWMYQYLTPYQVFNLSGTAQIHIDGYKTTATSTTVFPGIGIVKWRYKAGASSQFCSFDIQDDMILIGMYKNGEVLGDTVITVPPQDTIEIPMDIGTIFSYGISTGGSIQKKILTDLGNGVKEVNCTYNYPDSTVIKTEYWYRDKNTFAISESASPGSWPAYYYTELRGCMNQLEWGPAKNYQGQSYECQKKSSPNWGIQTYTSRVIGPILIEYYDGKKEGLREISVGVPTGKTDGVIKEYSLQQNYPNPFNPTTTIEYFIPSLSFVSLKVYDVLGREVITLVNEEKHAGQYLVNFDGSNLSSGVYLYELEVGGHKITKKLALLK